MLLQTFSWRPGLFRTGNVVLGGVFVAHEFDLGAVGDFVSLKKIEVEDVFGVIFHGRVSPCHCLCPR